MKNKTFLKAISALLAAVMIVLLVPPVEIEAYEHPTYADVVSVSVDDMTIVEGTRGNWCVGSDENGNETTWWGYEAYPDSYTVTFSDGSEQTLGTWDYVVDYRTGNYYCLGWSYDQSYENQWEVGTHTATAMIAGVETTYNVEIVENPIESISVEDVTILESTNGYWTYDWDEYGNTIEWWYYQCSPAYYTVNYKDGTSQRYESWENIEVFGQYYGLSSYGVQSYNDPWGVGTHTGVAEIAGFKTTYNVEIVETPIESVYIDDITIIEGTNGYWNHGWDEFNNQVTWWQYDIYPENYTVKYKDGTEQTLSMWDSLEICGKYYSLEYGDPQWIENQWGLGTYTVNAEIAGFRTTYNVEITESPIESIQIDDVSIIAGTNVNINYYYDEYNHLAGKWWNYNYSNDLEYTVTFRDGTTQTLSRWENIEIGGESYSLSIWDDQSYDNQWGAGTHPVTASIFGVETTFNVEITVSPIVEKIIVNDISAIVETDGSFTSDNGESWYEYSVISPEFTVVFKDGRVESGRGGLEVDGEWVSLLTLDDQSYYSRWGIGEHTVKASFLGVETEFVYEVLESPVAEIVFKDIELYENFDGYYDEKFDGETGEHVPYFHYYYTPEYTVILKDGSVIKSVNGFVEYNGEIYDVYGTDYNDQRENAWGIGTHKIEAKVLGYTGEFDVNVVECPYTAIEISGEKELYITLYKNDGTSETTKVLGYSGSYYNSGSGIMYTEVRDMYVVTQCDFGEDLVSSYEDLRVEIGNLVSNTLYGNEWCEAMMMANKYQSNINSYVGVPGKPSGYEGFNGTVTSANLNDIIGLSSRIYFDYSNFDTIVVEGEYFFYVKLDFVKECISKVFGITDIDLTKSDWYDPSRPDYIRVPEPTGWGGFHKMSLDYEDGFWVYESNAVWLSYKNMKIFMDEELHIKRIEFDGRCGPLKGDINGDRKLNISDLFMLKNALIKGDDMSEAEFAVMDLDGSGTVNISDLFMLKSILIG